jgi:hypothetical protein
MLYFYFPLRYSWLHDLGFQFLLILWSQFHIWGENKVFLVDVFWVFISIFHRQLSKKLHMFYDLNQHFIYTCWKLLVFRGFDDISEYWQKNIPNLFVSPSPRVKKGNHILTLKQQKCCLAFRFSYKQCTFNIHSISSLPS